VAEHERWDVVLKVLDGPLASQGEQVVRGPVVRIGAQPGPGGVALPGYRGLDARQCVITAYSAASATVAPVGANQVRLAPHPNVDWSDIDPMPGPSALTPGCALHLGPVGRGATLAFVACRRLGVWERGRLASDVGAPPPTTGAPATPGAPVVPAAFEARRVRTISASTAPPWFLGCMFLMSVTATAAIVGSVMVYLLIKDVPPNGPIAEGLELHESVQLDDDEVVAGAHEGLQDPFYRFVMKPNITAARADNHGWDQPEAWDQRLFAYTAASVEKNVQSWAFFKRIDAVRVEYAHVVNELRRAGLPEVFAGIPYQESRYRSDYASEVCADGWWQFMPEVAHRLEGEGLDFRVANCLFKGRPDVRWTPNADAPPRGARRNGPYMDDGECILGICTPDDRKDLTKSTTAAIFTLREAWDDPVFARSGSAVQMTMTSHNAGYNDARFGSRYVKPLNVLPAYKKWLASAGQDQGRFFVGENIRCKTHSEQSTCKGAYMAETQHYAYTIIAQHLLAVCYYAQNYGEEAAFKPWRRYTRPGGYCSEFRIPDRGQVRARRGRK